MSRRRRRHKGPMYKNGTWGKGSFINRGEADGTDQEKKTEPQSSPEGESGKRDSGKGQEKNGEDSGIERSDAGTTPQTKERGSPSKPSP